MKTKIAIALSAALAGLLLAGHVQAQGYAEDRAAIINLQSRYLLALDFMDAEAYASTFTEDGVVQWARGEIAGREAIRDFIASGTYNPASNAVEADWPAASRHFITNQVIKVDGDVASAITYWFQATNNADRSSMQLGLFGYYEDELAKVDGEWLFTSRIIYNEGLPGRNRAGMANPDPFVR